MRLKTIGLISILVIGLLAGPLPAEAQPLSANMDETLTRLEFSVE